MAEDLLFNIIGKLIGKLGSMAAESWNVRDELEKLVGNMSEIKAVVSDAEKQQGTSDEVQLWVGKLKDALDDADDLLDEFSTEDLRRQVMTKGKKAKKVRIFFSSSNQLVFSIKMAQKIKELRKTFEALNVDQKNFKFTSSIPNQRVAKLRETHSFIHEEEVIGREEERKELVELLLNTNIDAKENVSIISIIGIGGLGKTALAQLVYNDKAVQRHFKLKKWVCVSDDFDVKGIARKITGSESNELDQVQQELREKVGGQRYLLVLDDIWNGDREYWLQLMRLLKDGAKGSKIIITTRGEKVAKITGTSSLFSLKGLNDEQSWRLFSQLAFKNGKEPENQKLVSIGKEIVEKCSGVPLAIRSIGSLMYDMETEEDWANIRDKDLVNINDEQGVNTVFELIKLSYDHLPFHLKKCFAFCSLFPKDCEIDTTRLIRLWVAQGFVQSSDESACLEDVGYGYFLNLAHRSFFQDLDIGDFDGHIWSCKMHDLVHDLAKFVSGNDCVIVNEKAEHVDKQTRHISFGFPLDPSWQVPSSFLKAYKLRTFLVSQQYFWEQSLEDSAYGLVLSCFKKLRALDLNRFDRRKIPSCIGVLKHLRYLDLSLNRQIEVLPGSITKLNNLQTLLLNHCSELRELPQDLWRLTSLRHLELANCDKLTFMPRGIGQLTNLQTLTRFVLDTTSKRSGGASELRELNNLRGQLDIKGLECLRPRPTKAKDFNLLGKSHLQQLTLTWDKQIDAENHDIEKDYIILQELRLHDNIKTLSIKGFGGTTMFCSVLPLHLFLHLKSLTLVHLPCLEWIYDDSGNGSSSTVFPSLEEINLLELPNLKGWCRCSEEEMPRGCCHQFKTLDSLCIWNCPNLISIPQHTDIRRVQLRRVREKILQQAVNHSNVEELRINSINDLKSLSGFLQHLTALRELRIQECEQLDPCNDEDGCYSMQWKELKNLKTLEFYRIWKMKSLPEGLQHVTTLQRLEIQVCVTLTFIPEWVTSLQAIEIEDCPMVTIVPEGVKVRRNIFASDRNRRLPQGDDCA